MTKEDIERAKLFSSCKAKGIASITQCYHPDCNQKSINSHILQKNGILSSISNDGHLWGRKVNFFKEPRFQFEKIGINKIYSFNCFCNTHDTSLFKGIEGEKIDFNNYKSCLLFTLRTIYNEIWRKEVNIKMYDCLLEKDPEKCDNPYFREWVKQETLGLRDLRFTESEIWKDLNSNTESFVFENTEIDKLDICLSAFYNYDTTLEMGEYIQNHGKDMDRVSQIFVNIFPYLNRTVLLMGYYKVDEKKVKGYFYTYFKESKKRVQRKLTNLILFRCETWVVSDKLYSLKIAGVENLFSKTIEYSLRNMNERKCYDLNIYKTSFKEDLRKWIKNAG